MHYSRTTRKHRHCTIFNVCLLGNFLQSLDQKKNVSFQMTFAQELLLCLFSYYPLIFTQKIACFLAIFSSFNSKPCNYYFCLILLIYMLVLFNQVLCQYFFSSASQMHYFLHVCLSFPVLLLLSTKSISQDQRGSTSLLYLLCCKFYYYQSQLKCEIVLKFLIQKRYLSFY